jgi:hypothetical protein
MRILRRHRYEKTTEIAILYYYVHRHTHTHTGARGETVKINAHNAVGYHTHGIYIYLYS